MPTLESVEAITAFIRELPSAARESLYVETGHGALANMLPHARKVEGPDWRTQFDEGSRPDLVIADLPIGLRRETVVVGGGELRTRKNWVDLAAIALATQPRALLVAIVEPPGFGISGGREFEEAMNREGFFVNAYLNPPPGLFAPFTRVRPALVCMGRAPVERVFVSELITATQAVIIAKRYISATPAGSLHDGMWIPPFSFKGFDSLAAQFQLSKLETEFKEYETVRLGDIATEINVVQTGQSHAARDNAVYIPALGSGLVVYDMAETTIQHQNIIQVVLSDRANNEYVASFFKSELGKLILASLSVGATIPRISRSSLADAEIALPPEDEQLLIATTQRRLVALREAISVFSAELALNPGSAGEIKDQLEGMLSRIGGLSDADRIRSYARAGESKTIEFKETLTLDVRKGAREKYIETSALKTVAAFLNTDGGALLIGVNDEGAITGANEEISKHFKSKDAYLLHFKNVLKYRIGEQFYPFIDHRIVALDNAIVLLVECKASSVPCFMDAADFYVRTNPATDKLEGPKLVEYVKHHFAG